MSGVKYLLDTNIVIGILKQYPEVIAYISGFDPELSECAYSAVTRMELLGFGGISAQEDREIRQLLDAMHYLPLDATVEDATIQLRRSSGLKLPDSIIAATAQVHGLMLLTLDNKLQKIANRV